MANIRYVPGQPGVNRLLTSNDLSTLEIESKDLHWTSDNGHVVTVNDSVAETLLYFFPKEFEVVAEEVEEAPEAEEDLPNPPETGEEEEADETEADSSKPKKRGK